MGRFYWGIQKLLTQENGYHGASLGLIGCRNGKNKGDSKRVATNILPNAFITESGGKMGWIHYSYDADRRDEARGVITSMIIFGRHTLSLTRNLTSSSAAHQIGCYDVGSQTPK